MRMMMMMMRRRRRMRRYQVPSCSLQESAENSGQRRRPTRLSLPQQPERQEISARAEETGQGGGEEEEENEGKEKKGEGSREEGRRDMEEAEEGGSSHAGYLFEVWSFHGLVDVGDDGVGAGGRRSALGV